jgi:hypothetical protein
VRSSMTRIGVICRKCSDADGRFNHSCAPRKRSVRWGYAPRRGWLAGGRARLGRRELRAGMHFGTVAAAGVRCSSAGDRRRSVQTMAVPKQTTPYAGAVRIRPRATHPRLHGLVWGGKAVKPPL